MNVINLNSENLVVDWISFNLEGLMDPRTIADRLFHKLNIFDIIKSYKIEKRF